MQDIVIIGGGIVGLATGYNLLTSNQKLKVTILEKENRIASHQTGNNSGVVHSGLYYKPGSLKASNCIRGYEQLIRFAEENDIPHDICGKIVVATDEDQVAAMENLFDRGIANGLQGIRKLKKEELKEYEPNVAGIAGLFVPQTGIIDYSVVSEKLASQFEKLGGNILTGTKVTGITQNQNAVQIHTTSNDIEAKLIVNCAGLYSDKVARMTGAEVDIKIIPFRGEYYKLKKEKESLVNNLIYPVPDPSFPFLGVHFTRMMKGGVEAGPNAVFAFKREGYSKSDINVKELVESLSWPGFLKVANKYWKTGFGEFYRSFSKSAFTRALQKLVPDITADDLIKGGAGVRAQACDRKGGLVDDFVIIEKERAVNVCNAPSPAATSSLSIGQTISEIVLKRI
jgi:L-2-hydroxyglutarate oxidase